MDAKPVFNFIVCTCCESSAIFYAIKKLSIVHNFCGDGGQFDSSGTAVRLCQIQQFFCSMIHSGNDTVNIPLMSTVKLPSSIPQEMRDNYRMAEREELVSYIQQSLKTLDISMEALDKLAGCKKDTIRNFLTGKSKNWRADNKDKIINALNKAFSNSKTEKVKAVQDSSDQLRDSEIAIIGVLYSLFQMIADESNPTLRGALHSMLSDQQKAYQKIGLPVAEQVPQILLGALKDEKHGINPRMLLQMLERAPAGSA